MGNVNDKTTPETDEKVSDGAENKSEKSLAGIEKLAKKHPLAKNKNVYRESSDTSKDSNKEETAKVSAESEIGQVGVAAASGDVSNDEEKQNNITETDTQAETNDDAGAKSETNTEVDDNPDTDTEPQPPEVVGESEPYFIETESESSTEKEIESAENPNDGEETMSDEKAIEEISEENVINETPEDNNSASSESELLSEKEDEPAETETVQKDTLLSNLLKHLKTLPATNKAEKETGKEQDISENITTEDKPESPDITLEVEAPPNSEAPAEPGGDIIESVALEISDEAPAASTSQYVEPPATVTPAGNLDNSAPYIYNVPAAPIPQLYKAEQPTPSRRYEKSIVYTVFVILLAAMTLFTVFIYLLSPPGDSAGNVSGDTDEQGVTEPDKLEVLSWDENGLLYLSIDGTVLIVVNRNNRLPSDYGDGVDPEAKAAYDNMLDAAVRDGIYIYTAADYLDYESQDLRYNRYANYHGEDVVDKFMQKAGYSENQLGVAFHVNCAEADYMYSETFAQTPEYQWLIQNAAEYGFILRYPEGKESLTGYSFSPWHFRYVGVDLAKLMAESGMVIEEYLAIAEPVPAD